MIPSNLNQSSLPLKKRNQDQSHQLPTSTPTTNTSYPRPVFLDTSMEDQGANCREHHGHHYHQQQQQEKPDEFVMIDGSRDFLQSFSTNNNDQYVCDGYHHEDGHGSVKWMPSKMRWMRKIVASEQTVRSKPTRSMENLQEKEQHNQDSNSNFPSGGITRVCSDCSTTKTPLWRSGPQGPKSLCNACGIRQRKARRAAMAAAAAAAAGSGLLAKNTPRKVQKEKRTDTDRAIHDKKRCKIDTTRTAQKKLQTDDIVMSLSNNSAFHRVFPQDETDAAILLMALSCGLIHG